MSERKFNDQPAKRERVPLLVGLFGPSGSGKTFSALRLATGMQRITGGDIYGIDTESRRMLHYADDFKFQHLQFDSPFSPLDYLAAIDHCTQKGASIVIVDSLSHEHEGPGGVLEWHDQETERLAKAWNVSRSKAQLSAWQEPKAARRRLINTILQLGINAISCFRAKEKLKIIKGKDPIPLGWMPIAGDEFLYEQTVNCLLYPGSGGVPTWKTDEVGEKTMLKLPRQFESIFATKQPLSEDIGQQLAEWAAGGKAAPQSKPKEQPQDDTPTDEECASVVERIMGAESTAEIERIAAENRGLKWSGMQRGQIKQSIDQRKREL